MSLLLNGNSLKLRTQAFKVEDPSQIGVVRRFAMSLADDFSFDEEQKGRLGIVINELCTNLLHHARHGDILVRPIQYQNFSAIEILAVDRGPGIKNISESMVDGYSSSSTPGNGLGAIRRQSDVFDIYSIEGQGTVVLSIVNQIRNQQPSDQMQFGIICIPIDGERESGDAWEFHIERNCLQVMVADGLGHGLLAHEASTRALEIFSANRNQPLPLLMELVHQGLKSTRGAAVSIAKLNFETGILDFIGVGNIRCLLLEQEKMKTLVCQSGTAGLQIRLAKLFSLPWTKTNLLILHSDGINTRWDLNNYQGLLTRHPSIIAAVLYRDANRNSDDVTVFIGGYP